MGFERQIGKEFDLIAEEDLEKDEELDLLIPGKVATSSVGNAENGGLGAGARSITAMIPGRGRSISARASDAVAAARTEAGAPLPPRLLAELERSLGLPLAGVRLHIGQLAARAAAAVSARAFALGNEIFFADGAFAPDTEAGRALIAHEVAHAANAEAAPSAIAPTLSRPEDRHERVADAFASAFAVGHRPARPENAAAPAGVISRQEEGPPPEKSHEDQLREIQAMQMSSLLVAIAALPADVKTDYAASHVGGPRLRAAMQAVNHGGDWKSYIDANHGFAGHLPADQLEDLMKYLGGPPTDYGYYKDFKSFDGSVDGGSKVVTLYFRVKFVVPENGGARFPGAPEQGQPGWDTAMREGLVKFGQDFKREIESQWSGKGTIQSAVKSLGSFTTVVNVAVVETGAHSTITVVTNSGRSNHVKGGDHGTFGVADNDMENKEGLMHGPGGTQPIKTRQTTSAHEFGHAIGLDHPDDYQVLRQAYMDEKDPAKKAKLLEQLRAFNGKDGHMQELEYGDTPEEQRHMMGAGNEVKVIRGDDGFDPFVPFQKIATAWGKEHIKNQTLNKWSSS